MEWLTTILEILQSPEFYALLLGLLASLKALGEAFEALGNLIAGDDWFELTAPKIARAVGRVGQFLNYLAPGNKRRGN